METLSLNQFIAEREQFDGAVLNTPDIFRFCSGSSWQLAAHRTLYPDRDTLFLKNGKSYQAWAIGPLYEFSKVLQPLEADWYFGCPSVGNHTATSARFLLDTLLELRGEFPLIWLSGIPEESYLKAVLLNKFSPYFRLFRLEGCHCQMADLGGGWEHYLTRRSGKFRRELKRVRDRADAEGVTPTYFDSLPDTVSAFLERVLQLEERSWKGRSAESIFIHDRFRQFYTELIGDLDARGNFRAVFLQKDSRDIAYAMGGMLGREYRGFQMTYDQEFSDLSPGHLAQFELIRRLGREGCKTYDLGMEMPYKSRWSDQTRRIANYILMNK